MNLGWTLESAAAAVGGTLIGTAASPIDRVGTDSRTIRPGDLFVALGGVHFDGHDFVPAARAAGAVAVVVAAGRRPDAVPRIEVADPHAALRDLAVLRRSELTMPVIAITGSTGKTSTKDLLAAALPHAGASPRSFNNEVGVPLTLLGVEPDVRYLVLEVGSRGRGHIAWLAPAVRPDVAVVTNLGLVHLETFGDRSTLADAKWELVEMLGPTGTAVLPDDEPRLQRPTPGPVVFFGGPGGTAEVRHGPVDLDEHGYPRFVLHTPEGDHPVRLELVGAHHARNAAAAMAAALAVGADPGDVAARMSSARPAPWRMEVHRGAITVVNDAYNANPTSMAAALRTVAGMGGRRFAVLGRMAELGPVEEAEHRRIGELVAELGFERVIVVGPDPGIAPAAGPAATTVPDAAAAVAAVRDEVRPGDVVLVKASRASGLERVAEALERIALEEGVA